MFPDLQKTLKYCMREISFFTFCVILIQYNSSGNRIAGFDSAIVEYLVFLYIDNPHRQYMGLFFPVGTGSWHFSPDPSGSFSEKGRIPLFSSFRSLLLRQRSEGGKVLHCRSFLPGKGIWQGVHFPPLPGRGWIMPGADR